MGSKNKLKRFKENETFENVIQPSRNDVLEGFSMAGHWNEFFQNDDAIVLELGCGKGEYSVALGQENPNKNFIGVDIKGARFWRGAKTALEKGMKNVAFLRTQIELIDKCFAENEISEIWITFPDPQIKYKRTKHRMVTRRFLEMYELILNPEGMIHLKTDSEFLHGYLLGLLHEGNHEVLYAHHDIYNSSSPPVEATSIQTFYESQYLEKGKAITYTRFRTNYRSQS